MRRTVILLALGLGGLVALGAGLWLWERTRRPPSAERPPERLLIGFDPGRVERVRLEMGDAHVDRRRQQGEWIPMPGFPDGGFALRVDSVLEQLATLEARLVSEERSGRGKPLPDKGAVVEIAVWRGGVRPLRLSFYQQGRKVVVRTSDRPGVYEVAPGLLSMIRRELRQAAQEAALKSDSEQVRSLRVQRQGGDIKVIRKGRKWFLEEGGALAAADSAAVGRLLGMLHLLRIRERLGEGEAARAKHGLGMPLHTVSVEADKTHRLLLGGPCPRDPSGRVAALGPTGDAVVCVGPVDSGILGAPLASDRIFGLGADEIQAITVQRGRATLALVNRPGGGGWSMISPTESPVDQGAAQRLVNALSELRGRPRSEEPPAEADRPLGRVKLTPLVGEPEAVDLFGGERGAGVRWARRAGGGRWVALPEGADALLGADPVVLRSHALCQCTQEGLLAVMRSPQGGYTELSWLEGGVWQLALLQGRRAIAEAYKIGESLERFRPAAKPGERPTEVEWTPPVLLVEQGDVELRDALLFQVCQARAKAFVASRATQAHGLDRDALLLSALFHQNCREEEGKRRCDVASCALELGGPVKEGGCYGRVPTDGAVFEAAPALCAAARRPVASRQVSETPLHVLASITLTVGSAKVSFAPREGTGWHRTDGKPLPDGGASETLLFLAPLQAEAVVSYGRGVKAAPALTASLSQPQLAPVVLKFYESATGYEVVRGDRPLRYRVPGPPVKKLIALVGTR